MIYIVYALYDGKIVINIRLDADDGLEHEYLELLQYHVSNDIMKHDKQLIYYCSRYSNESLPLHNAITTLQYKQDNICV